LSLSGNIDNTNTTTTNFNLGLSDLKENETSKNNKYTKNGFLNNDQNKNSMNTKNCKYCTFILIMYKCIVIF